jgi:RecA-family ATPase
LKKKFPPGEYIIGDGLLNRGSVLVIGGPPKSYKSITTNSILCHLAVASNLFNTSRSIRESKREPVFRIDSPASVLYLEQEVGQHDLQERFKSHLKSFSREAQLLCGELISTHSCDFDLRLDTREGIDALRKVIKDAGNPDVVCFDPLIKFHCADENSASEMSEVLRNLDILRAEFGFAVILIHHTGKMNGETGRHGPDRLRGSSVLFATADSVMLVDPDAKREGLVKLSFTLRRSKPLPDCWIRINENSLVAEFVCWGNDPNLADKRGRVRKPGENLVTMGAKLG